MALIKCTDCGKMFSDRAEKCPVCGCTTEHVKELERQKAEEEKRKAEEEERRREEERERRRKEEEERLRKIEEKRAARKAYIEKNKGKIITCVVLALLCIPGIIYWAVDSHQRAVERAEREEMARLDSIHRADSIRAEEERKAEASQRHADSLAVIAELSKVKCKEKFHVYTFIRDSRSNAEVLSELRPEDEPYEVLYKSKGDCFDDLPDDNDYYSFWEEKGNYIIECVSYQDSDTNGNGYGYISAYYKGDMSIKTYKYSGLPLSALSKASLVFENEDGEIIKSIRYSPDYIIGEDWLTDEFKASDGYYHAIATVDGLYIPGIENGYTSLAMRLCAENNPKDKNGKYTKKIEVSEDLGLPCIAFVPSEMALYMGNKFYYLRDVKPYTK